jgi:hypothetical protein
MMDAERKRRLEAAGFKFGTVGELFGLSEAEEQLVELKVAIAEAIRASRDTRDLSQADLRQSLASDDDTTQKGRNTAGRVGCTVSWAALYATIRTHVLLVHHGCAA